MKHLYGRMLTSVFSLLLVASIAAWDGSAQNQRKPAPVAGKGNVILPLPDLTVNGAFKVNYTCNNGTLGVTILATITNKGQGPAVLASNWTKPWVSANTSVAIPGFVKPSQTGAKTVTLSPGASESIDIGITVPPPPGGVGYDVIVQVDPSNAIKETNEQNNTSKIPVPAKVCG
jgi:subtilase family serine protease